MRHDVVFSENYRQGLPVKQVPAQATEGSALSVRHEVKKSKQETNSAAPCGVIRMMRKQESAEAIVAQRRE